MFFPTLTVFKGDFAKKLLRLRVLHGVFFFDLRGDLPWSWAKIRLGGVFWKGDKNEYIPIQLISQYKVHDLPHEVVLVCAVCRRFLPIASDLACPALEEISENGFKSLLKPFQKLKWEKKISPPLELVAQACVVYPRFLLTVWDSVSPVSAGTSKSEKIFKPSFHFSLQSVFLPQLQQV